MHGGKLAKLPRFCQPEKIPEKQKPGRKSRLFVISYQVTSVSVRIE